MFARNVGSAWEIDAPAKLNLYLEVLGPPDEGFHPLETLMVPVRIFDQLRWSDDFPEATELSQSRGCSLKIRNFFPPDESATQTLEMGSENLVIQAARRLAQSAGIQPFGKFELVKRIPMQAGLGGGSSDAAAAMLLANRGWKLGYSRPQLMEIAADVGSDVPFFLTSGSAICRGRGEVVEPVTHLPRLNFVVVKPPIGLATAEVFSKLNYDHFDKLNTPDTLSKLLNSLRGGAIAQASRWMTNRLEWAAEQLTPWIEKLRHTFSQFGCHAHMMTGSGSSYVGVMKSAKQARRVARQIACMKLGNVFATASC